MLDLASATSVAPRSISALIAASWPSASSSRCASSSASRCVRSLQELLEVGDRLAHRLEARLAVARHRLGLEQLLERAGLAARRRRGDGVLRDELLGALRTRDDAEARDVALAAVRLARHLGDARLGVGHLGRAALDLGADRGLLAQRVLEPLREQLRLALRPLDLGLGRVELGLGDGQPRLDGLEVDDGLRERRVRVLELGLQLLAVAEDLGLATLRRGPAVVDVVGGRRGDTPHEEQGRGDQSRCRAAEVPGHLTPSCGG